MRNSRWKKPLTMVVPAFSLIEMSIVLVVIGLITGAVFKGQELLGNAKIRSVVQDFQHYSLAVNTYQEIYQSLPGDDPRATMHFTGTTPGDGNGQITGVEVDLFWQHLSKASIINGDKAPASKLGGKYTVVFQPSTEMPGHWLMLAKEEGSGLLTPKQAQALKNKIDQGSSAVDLNQGQLIVKDAPGATGRCIRDGHLNLDNKNPDCIIYYRF